MKGSKPQSIFGKTSNADKQLWRQLGFKVQLEQVQKRMEA